MGSTESLPVVSQVKSLVQAVSGDLSGAERTQQQFLKKCVVISQVTSLVQACQGDSSAARATQLEFLGELSSVGNSIPVLGHIKGTIHYVCGDHCGGDEAMKSSSRTVGVLVGGAGGFLVGGPAGAVAGGVAGGHLLDGITTGVHSAINGSFTPSGAIAGYVEIVKNPTSGNVFDSVVGVAMDGFAGYCAGKAAAKFQSRQNSTTVYRVYRVSEGAEAASNIEGQRVNGVQRQGQLSEVWMSESNHHQAEFLRQRQRQNPAGNYQCVKARIPKEQYQAIKAHAIDQRGSGAINKALARAGQPVKNVVNLEKLEGHPRGKVNLCIKGPDNLRALNSAVREVRTHDPCSLANSNGATKAAARYGRAGAGCHALHPIREEED